MLDTRILYDDHSKTCQVIISDGPIFEATFPVHVTDQVCRDTTLNRFSHRFTFLIEAHLDAIELHGGWVPAVASDGSLETPR